LRTAYGPAAAARDTRSARAREDGAEEPGLGAREAQVAGAGAPEPRPGSRRGRQAVVDPGFHRRAHGVGEGVRRALGHGAEQRLAAGVVAVRRVVADPRAPLHLAQGDGARATATGEVGRVLEQLVAQGHRRIVSR
jgi:hypothetical protein